VALHACGTYLLRVSSNYVGFILSLALEENLNLIVHRKSRHLFVLHLAQKVVKSIDVCSFICRRRN
jgi:hypothetical protein